MNHTQSQATSHTNIDFASIDIHMVLSQGLTKFDSYLMNSVNNDPQLSAQEITFFEMLIGHHTQSEYFLTHPDLFESSQQALYIFLDDHNFTPNQHLFMEFLIGLCRFDLCLRMTLAFYQFLDCAIPKATLNPSDKAQPFWTDLHALAMNVSQQTRQVLDITHGYTLSEFNYWEKSTEFFDTYPSLKQLAKQLISIQHIPQNKSMLGLAQTLHWSGFGGNGEILAGFEQLAQLFSYCIGYHQQQPGNTPFKVIFAQIEATRE